MKSEKLRHVGCSDEFILEGDNCMKIDYACLPCLVNQVVRVADITKAENKDLLFKKVFAYLSNLDFSKSNPEVIGTTYRLIKEHVKNDDPYGETRTYYNRLFLSMLDQFDAKIADSDNPFKQALKYAILGNIIDFNPIHNSSTEEIMKWFTNVDKLSLTIDHSEKLTSDLGSAQTLVYLGDNCGEICLDKLFLKRIKEHNPSIHIYFGVRGASIVNDSIEDDAYSVGIDEYADIISNGDDSLGTILSRTSFEFNHIYQIADVVISKGQANYESLSEQVNKNIYFLLMTKCEVIAKNIGVAPKSVICMNNCNNSNAI